MVLRKAEHQVQIMLCDTIVALCRNALPYKTECSIQGLLGITMDNEEVFLVDIKETIHKEGAAKRKGDTDDRLQGHDSDESQNGEHKGSRRKRKKSRPSRRKSHDSDKEEDSLITDSDDDSRLSRNEAVLVEYSSQAIKQEQGNDVMLAMGENSSEAVDYPYGSMTFPGPSFSVSGERRGESSDVLDQMRKLASSYQTSNEMDDVSLILFIGMYQILL